MHPLFYAALIFSAISCILMLYISLATLAYPEKHSLPSATDGSAGISIVIPFRNEAPRLSALLESLLKQDHNGPYEIILVNDGSSDDFRASVAPFLQSTDRPVKLIDSDFDASKKLTSKQQAVDAGVVHAVYPYVVFTDADMIFHGAWLDSLAAMIPAGYDLVFGHTAVRKSGGGFMQFLQAFQLEFLFAAAYGFHASKLPGSCMGNNLLIRKKAYWDIGGQSGIGYSIVEDRALFSAFKRKGLKISPARPFTALAETYPCPTLGGFSLQAARWARGGFLEQPDLVPAGALLCLQYLLTCLALCGWSRGALSVISFVNFGLTFFFVGCAFRKMRSRENALLFPLYYAALLIEIIAFFGYCALRPSLSWKNRKL